MRLGNYSPAPSLVERRSFRTHFGKPGQSINDSLTGATFGLGEGTKCEFADRGLVGTRVNTEETGSFEVLQIRDSLCMIAENFTSTLPYSEHLPSENMVSFHVQLDGSASVGIGRSDALPINGPSALAWRQPGNVDLRKWQQGRCRQASVTIHCRPAFIRNSLGASGTGNSGDVGEFVFEKSSSIKFYKLNITPKIIAVAQNILGSRLQGRLRLIHLEAMALELVCMVLEDFNRMSEVAKEWYSDADKKRFDRAREIMSSRFSPVPTIRSVAQEVGMNESKLKRGFKSLYGGTIFEFGHACRMEHAMQLLCKQKMAIALVAFTVGYAHQTSFASAFKKYFGCRPRDMRNCIASAPVERN